MKQISNPAIPFLLLVFAVMVQSVFSSPAPLPAELGTWWRDSEVVRELQLRDSQIKQIDQAFLSHRTELNSLAAELLRQEGILQSLIDTSSLDTKKAATQIEQVVSARARLEREKTMMALDIRQAVSFDQWRKLQEMQRSQVVAAPALAATKPAPKADGGISASEEPIYQVGGPVSDPVPVQRPMPAFTAQARERKVQGSVLLAVVIGKDGAVRNVKVLRGLGYGLDESAADTVGKRWLFKPSILNGQPVTVQAMIEVTFHLYQQ
jgi:TonB family protein